MGSSRFGVVNYEYCDWQLDTEAPKSFNPNPLKAPALESSAFNPKPLLKPTDKTRTEAKEGEFNNDFCIHGILQED